MILPVLLVGVDASRLHLLKFGDVVVSDICGRQRRGDSFIVGSRGRVHGIGHGPGCFGQLLHGGYAIIRSRGQSYDAGGDGCNGYAHTHNDVDAGDGSGQQGCSGGGYLGDDSVGGEGCDDSTD